MSDFQMQVDSGSGYEAVEFSVKIARGKVVATSSIEVMAVEMVPVAPIAAAQSVRVGYAQPVAAANAGALQDAAGNFVSNYGWITVTNVVGVVPAAVPGAAGPPVTGSRVNYPNTNQILLEFTKPISSSLSGPLTATDFTIVGVNSGATVTSVQITSGKVLLTLPGVIVQSDTAQVDYTGNTGNTVLKSADDLTVANFNSLNIETDSIPNLAVKNATFDDTAITIEYIRPVIAPDDPTNFLSNWEYSLRETSNGDLKGGNGAAYVPSGFNFVNDTIVLTRAVNEGNGGGRWSAAFIALSYTAPTLAERQKFYRCRWKFICRCFPACICNRLSS